MLRGSLKMAAHWLTPPQLAFGVRSRPHLDTLPANLRGPVKGVLTGHLCARFGRGMLISVDTTNDIAEFLSSRRARVTPEQVGLPTYGTRRVKGLRREEVASLAGVSVEYYKRLERGNASGVSDSVLEALARALQLDDAERAHLLDLARAANPIAPKRRRPAQQRVRPVVLRILESITSPAILRNIALTTWPRTRSAARSTRRCSTASSSPLTARASLSLTQPHRTSMSTGSAPQKTSSHTCAPRPAATPTTAGCLTSSASCRPAAPSSGPGGRRTTSATTRRARSACATRSSASSSSTTRSWTSPPTTV
jgi:transcriptional regulator with XRE-family HTH domain